MRWNKADIFFRYLKKSQRIGWVGLCWRFLERIGTTTRSSPVRRTIQLVCLIAFLDAFTRVCWPYGEAFSNGLFSSKEYLPVDTFLLIDPLVGLSTALAGKIINIATLGWMFAILLFCVLIPRAFCGYFCPLGTLIDGFDWLVGRHFKRFHVKDNPRSSRGVTGWVDIKYYLLIFVLATSMVGILTSGFVSAIPVLTRGLLFSVGLGQIWWFKGVTHLPAFNNSVMFSLGLFSITFLLSLKGKRFWCRYVCPSGAVFSVLNRWRIGERKVEDTCINCNKCIEICPFDAIEEDFTTRTNDCTYCQSCGGVCPTQSIKFVSRWNDTRLKIIEPIPEESQSVSRRGFIAAGLAGITIAGGHQLVENLGVNEESNEHARGSGRPLRPPGSVPEDSFLDLCIRCGECFKVCPGPVLQPSSLEFGLEAIWTPVVTPEHAGCHQECNFCTQVCPTGAIQPLNIDVKKSTHIGLARINEETCLPFREDGREDCNLCYLECVQAGYNAIEMRSLSLPIDRELLQSQGYSDEIVDEMSSIMAPYVDSSRCVGCGICTYRCHTRYVKQEGRLEESAIVVHAENEHRRYVFPNDARYLGPPDT
jgi:NAD-dependent dihydropyrimidine dehydrogenase PreA subunit